MIVKHFYKQRSDGVNLYRTYSDLNVMIRQLPTDAVYAEAIDVEDASYTYEETDIPAPPRPVEDEATIEDTYNALNTLGVKEE